MKQICEIRTKDKQEQPIQVVVEYRNIKGMNMRITGSYEVKIHANPLYTDAQILDFVERKKTWILKQVLTRRQQDTLKEKGVFLLGVLHDVEYVEANKNDVVVANNKITVSYIAKMNPQKILERYLVSYGHSVLLQSVDRCMPVFPKLKRPEVTMKHMKSRWGMCKVMEGEIVLNLKLLHVPRACIDYVVVHELMHFYFPDHQSKFHMGMEKALPDYRQRRKVLRDFEFLLRD